MASLPRKCIGYALSCGLIVRVGGVCIKPDTRNRAGFPRMQLMPSGGERLKLRAVNHKIIVNALRFAARQIHTSFSGSSNNIIADGMNCSQS